MPRIRVLQAVAGPDFSWAPGEEIDVPGDVAQVWADGVRAEMVRGEPAETPEDTSSRQGPQVETATEDAPGSTEGETTQTGRRPRRAGAKPEAR